MTDPQPLLEAIEWHPADADLVLIAVDERGIETARALVATLPNDARGTVFMEVEHLDDAETLHVPKRMSVRLLVRDRGQRIERAVDAWLEEMLPSAGAVTPRIYAWVSSRGPARLLTAD